MDRPYRVIQVARADGICRVTLNNPARRNAIGPAMVNELLYAFGDATSDKDTRVVILTGAGEAFCAGGDLAQMSGGGAEADLPPKGDYADLLLAMVRSSKPIVARVNGHAMGGGLGLVAASHFAVASRAAKLGTPEINVGLFPMMIMAVLARVMPRRRLFEMMLFGDRMDADQAAACGLVSRAVDAEQLDSAVQEITTALLAKSPITMRLGLEAFAAQDDLDLETALPLLRQRLTGCLATDDAREGLMAFLQKRPPVWTGK